MQTPRIRSLDVFCRLEIREEVFSGTRNPWPGDVVVLVDYRCVERRRRGHNDA